MKKLIFCLLFGFIPMLGFSQTLRQDTLSPPSVVVVIQQNYVCDSADFQPQAPQNAKKPKPQKAPVKKKKFMKRGDFWSNVLDLTKIIVPALVTVLAATSAK
ncbi:hypothetical protein [Flectobacillus roseus]|uniref:hypothetical protein n=1 Tax=Flectobacillus roseus TaxID=502259 RepID=UPI0024B736CA|nr:hypothetical protein [Flectobacillus roseus]MDI9872578.1 hypothetical protein [Flectobacillus roseus]